MTSGISTPLISADSDDHQALGDAIATEIAHLPHRPRLLGFGEPMHGGRVPPSPERGLRRPRRAGRLHVDRTRNQRLARPHRRRLHQRR
jgi:hypothetical protein